MKKTTIQVSDENRKIIQSIQDKSESKISPDEVLTKIFKLFNNIRSDQLNNRLVVEKNVNT
ncbi:MAG TPA: hypothetical protein ENI23_12645 [bacterium]|nr:hypothetical protein [bacterium]